MTGREDLVRARDTVSVIGGTGALGFGLALRWAIAGTRILIGSRSEERAQEVAARVSEQARAAGADDVSVEGLGNEGAAEHARTVVLAMGNPYLAQDFPEVQNYLCTFSNVPISEASVTKALFGEIATHGHLPVSIPNIARRGAGIEREAQLTPGESDHANSKPNGQ